MNIAELLKKYAKVGDVFYSLIHGECILTALKRPNRDNFYPIEMDCLQTQISFCLSVDGTFYNEFGECILFPSKDQRDWAKWAEEQEAEKKDLKKDDYIKVDYDNGVIRLGKIVRICKSTIVVNPLHKEDEYELSVFKDKTNYKVINKWSADMFKAGQLVLVRDASYGEWCLSTFSHVRPEERCYSFVCINHTSYEQCIPYNFETKHLLGTSTTPADFYIF